MDDYNYCLKLFLDKLEHEMHVPDFLKIINMDICHLNKLYMFSLLNNRNIDYKKASYECLRNMLKDMKKLDD